MFWWFKRGDEFVRYESRARQGDVYELIVRATDGTERIERFNSAAALAEREAVLRGELAADGWSGPHGWNL